MPRVINHAWHLFLQSSSSMVFADDLLQLLTSTSVKNGATRPQDLRSMKQRQRVQPRLWGSLIVCCVITLTLTKCQERGATLTGSVWQEGEEKQIYKNVLLLKQRRFIHYMFSRKGKLFKLRSTLAHPPLKEEHPPLFVIVYSLRKKKTKSKNVSQSRRWLIMCRLDVWRHHTTKISTRSHVLPSAWRPCVTH